MGPRVTRRSFLAGLCAAGACGGEPLLDPTTPSIVPEPPPPATATAVHPAIGPLTDLDEAQRRLYVQPEAFSELGQPAAHSWRARVSEPSQSYPEFVISNPNPPRAPRDRLYLLPLGSFPTELVVEPLAVALVRSPPLGWLAQYLEAYFGLPVTVMDPRPLEPLEVPYRERNGHDQLDARALLSAVAPLLPDDAYSMTVLINRDLFVSAEQHYAFGYGLHRDRLAVMSFAQLDPMFMGYPRPDGFERDIERRSLLVLGHEVGHTFGMRHCHYYACAMNGMSHTHEVDQTPLHLCPVCLRKLVSLGAVDPLARYERLRAFYEEAKLADAAAWVQRRLEHTRPTLAASRRSLSRDR